MKQGAVVLVAANVNGLGQTHIVKVRDRQENRGKTKAATAATSAAAEAALSAAVAVALLLEFQLLLQLSSAQPWPAKPLDLC